MNPFDKLNFLKGVTPSNPPSIYNILVQRPYFHQLLDELIEASEKSNTQATITTKEREYNVYINPIISGVSESDVPYYIKKRIKKANK